MRGTADLGAIAASAAVDSAMRLVAVGDQGRDTLARLERIAIGERLPALLHSRFSDGSFQVELAGTSLRMSLPPGMQVGQRIELSLLAREPRPTFLLQNAGGGVQAEVSQAGRLIDTLLRPERPADGAKPAVPQALINAARPVAAGPVTQSEPLARALASALSGSGLFYESHVAQWVNGGRSLEQLQQEPQFHWTQKNLARPQQAAPWAAGTSDPHAAAPQSSANAAFTAAATVDAVVQVTSETPALNVDPASEAAQMMRLQLETLEHSQVLWRGQAWPGLPMEWGVAEDGSHGVEGERNWQSVLRFHFDELGTVAATLTLSGGQVQLALQAESEDIAARLRGAATDLADAMKSAGTPLHLMTVRQEKAP